MQPTNDISRDIRVSAILPVYNCAATVGAVLDALFASGIEQLEAIVVDDASTDDTAAICARYPVRLIRRERNSGPAVCRNLAVYASGGEVLLFLDSDIAFEPALPQAMLEHLRQHPELAGIATLTSPNPLNPGFAPRWFALQEYLRFADLIDEGMQDWSFISTRCGLLRRTVFDEVGGFNESCALAAWEDLEFSARMDNRHRLALDKRYLVRHYWPDSIWKICKRLHINARDVFCFPLAMRRKAAEPFYRDRNARFLVGLSLLAAAAGCLWPPAWVGAGAAHLAALHQARWFIRGCLRLEGPSFCLKAWGVYCLMLAIFATGIIEALLWPARRGKGGTGL